MNKWTTAGRDNHDQVEKEAYLGLLKEELERQAGEGEKLVYRNMVRNNGVVRESVSVLREGSDIAPVVYLDSCYDQHVSKGVTAAESAQQILHYQSCSECVRRSADAFFGEYGDAGKNIAMRLINCGRNRELLEEVPHRMVEDMAILYYYTVFSDAEGSGAILIRNADLSRWKISEEDFFKDAESNASRLLPPVIRSVSQMLGLPDQEEDLYVLTNTRGVYGSSCLFYPGMFSRILDRFQTDCYILPSSVHEVLILPVDGECDPKALSLIVREINRTEVSEEDYLSDSVYLLSRQGLTCI